MLLLENWNREVRDAGRGCPFPRVWMSPAGEVVRLACGSRRCGICGVGYRLIEDGAQYEDYPVVTQRALVFHGRQDEVVPAQFSVDFAERAAAVELHVLESDHQLLNVLDFMWSRIRVLMSPRNA